jgi:hypothetical protein
VLLMPGAPVFLEISMQFCGKLCREGTACTGAVEGGVVRELQTQTQRELLTADCDQDMAAGNYNGISAITPLLAAAAKGHGKVVLQLLAANCDS